MPLSTPVQPGEPNRDDAPIGLSTALDSLHDETGRTLRQITDERPTLVVLLRHAGCTFCRQTLADLAAARAAIAARGLLIVVIGMTDSTGSMRRLGARCGLGEVLWIADPNRRAYKA
ncbi:MAG: hypothetical protein AABZ53_12040, partial [Planctomycetota bacterium]